MNRKHKGAWNELRAICWLLEQGYEVYRNVSPFGLIDIIATKDNELLKIDVKSAASLRTIIKGTSAHVEQGIQWLLMTDGGQIGLVPVTARESLTDCKECGRPFNAIRRQRYCSLACRKKVDARTMAQHTQRKKFAAKGLVIPALKLLAP